MNDYNFGNFLCMLREQKGMTQAELAQQLSVTPAAVSKWENGESKPRIETLFQLAEILGVTAEELMAGKFLEIEKAGENEFEALRVRYEYLSRINTLLTVSVRIKRVVAFLIDAILTFSAFMVISCIIDAVWTLVFGEESDFDTGLLAVVILLICLAGCGVGIWLRDLICKGRSLGKRIMGLTIIDKSSGEPATKRQLVLRNIFLFLYNFDILFLLVRGTSIGDGVAKTLVVCQKQKEKFEQQIRNNELEEMTYINKSPKSAKKMTVIIIAVVLCFAVLFGGVVFAAVKGFERLSETVSDIGESEEYLLAVKYLTETGKLEKLEVEKEDVIMKSFRKNTDLTKNITRAEFEFVADGYGMLVVCYKENEKWYVCEACSDSSMTECPKHLK